MAPPAMVKIYGSSNGFGWKHQEIIGAQIVSVPMALPIENANRAFYTFMTALTIVFVVLFILLNVMLSFLVVRPIRLMSQAADQISTGNTDVADLKEKGKDEVAQLAKAFNRMRRSLEKAIQLIDSK
jgi:protein-histidine pros-kinase